VIELRVPALRERAEDIAPLARAFLQREAVRAGRPLELGAAALQRLQAHPWPGNVRELENAIVRLCVLARGPEITAADIDEHALGERPDAGTGAPLPTLQLKELERLAIAAAMARYAGNKRQAAAALGVALKTLYNKLHAADGGPIDDAEVAGEESVGPPIGPS
jgi:DNA-binding NtrC family response regulator